MVGGMLGVMGHAARGLGDTVSVLGHVAEEITAETGKVRVFISVSDPFAFAVACA